MATIFALSSLTVMPFWFLLIALPKWSLTRRIARSPLIALGPALIYALLVIPRIGEVLPAVMNPDLAAIAALLGSEAGATIAWVHFLAFDLLVGRWIYLDGHGRGISALVLAPLLFFTLMLGPLGLLAYLALRAVLVPRSAIVHSASEMPL
ncbi:MAG: DUF4281 domain-containing protein [Oscillochloris sp.]|nr:DUF4281 domain-containing protein [Oscillochloris sp.]